MANPSEVAENMAQDAQEGGSDNLETAIDESIDENEEIEGEESEEETDEDTDEEDVDTDEDVDEDPDLEDEEAEETEDLFYDAERDFPDSDVQPTKYKDRVALNSGFTEKVRYLREKKSDIEENGGRFGAIPLPDYFNGDESMIDQVVDRDAVAEMDDEAAKKAVHDLDVAIKRSSSKADRLIQQKQQRQQKKEVSQEYQQATEDLAGALDHIGLQVDDAKAMTVEEINAKADEAIAELEDEDNAHEFIENNSAQQWRKAIQDLENAKKTVREFPEKAKRYKEQANSDSNQQFDPELTKSTYKGMKEDRPDHPVFEGETAAREEDFLEYVRGKIERQEIVPPQHEREWVDQADNYVDMIEQEKRKYEQRKEKSSKKDKSGKSKTADDSPVKKDKDKKPSARDIGDQRSRRDVLTTKDIDDDIDALARDMN